MKTPAVKALIRRRAPGEWIVIRPGYGFGRFTVTVYPTWKHAMRSVQFVALGGAGTFDRDPKRGQGVSV